MLTGRQKKDEKREDDEVGRWWIIMKTVGQPKQRTRK